ncbi:MAG: hypothetical protein R3249_05510 [Nitriliruptorales bacterium]|nr:hypothetical protein [Nitriliruptorales bacterium]
MAGLFIGLVVAAMVPASYEARSTLLLTQPSGFDLPGVGSDQGGPERFVATQADVAESATVLLPAAESVGLELPIEDLREKVTVTVIRDTDVLEIRAVLDDAEDAVDLANAVAAELDALVTGQAQRALDEVLSRLGSQREQLVGRLAEIDAALVAAPGEALRRDRQVVSAQLEAIVAQELAAELQQLLLPRVVTVIEPATMGEQVFPSSVRFAVAGAVLALALAASIAWWRLAARQRAPDHLEIERALGAPILAAVPHVRRSDEGPVAAEPDTLEGAAYRLAGSVLRRQMEASGLRIVLVTSASVGDGKSTTAINLAGAVKATGENALVARWDRSATGPLGDPRQVAVGSLAFESVTLGPDQLHGRAFPDLLARTEGPVIVDGPSMIASTEVRRLASSVDGVVVVIREPSDHPTLARIARFLATLEQPTLGLVVFEARSS